ncbi:MAG: response regulator transcription factor [Ardenticatenaceae bacterium]|nr:response regulator transcription factor [Ardenticatenaceae bacterium]
MKQPLHILIADNRPAIRRGLKALLTQYPQINIVGEAADGREAVQLAAQLKPDVILMDMQMPVMDGLEATRRIKSQGAQIRVIALTLYSSYRAEALQAGVDAFLLKGCTADCLLDAILERVPANGAVR